MRPLLCLHAAYWSGLCCGFLSESSPFLLRSGFHSHPINVMNAWDKNNLWKERGYLFCMYVCVFVGMNVWMWCICDTCICVQFCIQEWVCRCKGQTRRSGVQLSASLPYPLETVTPTNPEDRQAARNLSGPSPQQHGVRWSPNHTHFYRSSGSLNSCLHTHSKSVPSHFHPPVPRVQSWVQF